MDTPADGKTLVLYDGQCAMCSAGGIALAAPLAAKGIASSTLQHHRPHSPAPDAMQIITPDGRTLHGADCWLFIARQLWWARPLTWLAHLSGGTRFLHHIYALVARNRHALSRIPIWTFFATRRARPTLWIQTTIAAPRDRVWELTQTPDLHQRWDLRFSNITYLPRSDSGPQQFRYVTRIGFGFSIAGAGETTGVRTSDNGTWTSSLTFWSDDRLSLIRTGAGFWRYQPRPAGTFFMTRYDYQTRFALPGRLADRLLFRPLMAWATAWSFDRLKIWAERGTPPETSRAIAIAATIARLAVAAYWLYGGLVPKLLTLAPDELAFASRAFAAKAVLPAIHFIGVLEVLLGLAILLLWHRRWPLLLTLALLAAALAFLFTTSRREMLNMFSPLVFNLSVAAFTGLALLLQPLAPSCSHIQWGVGRAEEAP